MCIAILNTQKSLDKEQLENSWANNNQGAGLLYNHNGKLVVYKSYKKDKFIKEYYRVRKLITGKIVLHFRIATSGHKEYVNLHPFLVNDSLGFVHNGIISGLGDKDYSDTYYFNELLKNFKHDFLNCKSTLTLIESAIGSSKLLFLDSYDNHYIVNEQMGHWSDGNWYSNDSYKDSFDYYYFGNEKVSKSNYNYYNTFDNFDSIDNYVSDKELSEHMYYYTNAMSYNIDYLAQLLEMDKNTKDFVREVEDISYMCNSLDIEIITEYVWKNYYEYDNGNVNYNIND